MARIRSIKPEFWTSEQVMECSRETRLFFIGLWNFCDDYGRHPAQAKKLRALIFAGDDDVSVSDVRRMIDELSTNGLVSIYVVDNIEYIEVCGWSHQKIDKKQSPKFPAPSEGVRRTFDERSASDRRTVIERSTPDRIGREGNRIEEDIPSPSEPGADAPPAPSYTDARHELWGEGKPLLLSLGIPQSQCGKLIGQWLKTAGDDCAGVLDAIRRAIDARPHQPIPWITKAIPSKARPHDRTSIQARPDPRPSGTQRALAGLAQAASERPDSRLFAMDSGGVGIGPGPAAEGAGDGRSPGLPPLRLIDG